MYGQALGQYLDDPSNLFIVSSDFCHWGSRFSFTYYDSSKVQQVKAMLMQLCLACHGAAVEIERLVCFLAGRHIPVH